MIHRQVPLPVPCYDFTLITDLTLAPPPSKPYGVVYSIEGGGTSGTASSLGVTGGEYKIRERIHRDIADSRLLVIPAS